MKDTTNGAISATVPADAIAELDARFSAIARELAEDDRPEPDPTVGGATVKRAKYDGLTGAERAQIYDATAYTVTESADGEWTVSHTTVPAVFVVRRSGERGLALVQSNTGHEYRVNIAEHECPCTDHRRNSDYRECKHLTACRAVRLHHRAKKAAEEAAQEAILQAKYERNRARLDAYIETQQTSDRRAA